MNQAKFTSEIYAHSNHLMSHALKFTRDEDDAKDLLQETLIKGLRFASSFDQGTNLRGWLYVIVKNTYINDFNKTAKRKPLSPLKMISPADSWPTVLQETAEKAHLHWKISIKLWLQSKLNTACLSQDISKDISTMKSQLN